MESLGADLLYDLYMDLMPVQKMRLKELCGINFQNLIQNGSIISIGLVLSENAIDSINVVVDGKLDKKRWNEYGIEYDKMNKKLDAIAERIADNLGGKTIAETLGGLVEKVEDVEYFPLTISHRVVAENASLG
ncbi:MAG: hypothetical protein ACUVTL_08650 [Thermoproteota archaeon]